MAPLSTSSGNLLVWTTTCLLLFCAVLTSHVTNSASHGEYCSQNIDCEGNAQICSGSSLCTCAKYFTYIAIENECQADERLLLPDFSFNSGSVFPTDMTNSDLDAERLIEMKTALEAQLTELFQFVTGFKKAVVHVIQISETGKLLMAGWTVIINRLDPRFDGKTPEEIGNIIQPELERAKELYNTTVHLDTKKRTKGNDEMALGLGIGLGGLGLIFVGVIVGIVLCMRWRSSEEHESRSVPDTASTGISGGSSEMDPACYQYKGFMKTGSTSPPLYTLSPPPPLYNTLSPPPPLYDTLSPPPPLYDTLSPPSHLYDILSLPSTDGSQSSVYMKVGDRVPLQK